jgi:chromosomal replication initiator protein
MAMYLARELAGASLHDIGVAFGGRNHTTVVHACAQVKKRANADKAFDGELATIRDSLASRRPDRKC